MKIKSQKRLEAANKKEQILAKTASSNDVKKIAKKVFKDYKQAFEMLKDM